MTAPKAFCIHTTADNGDFVIPLAAQLRAAGIDVWLSDWELLGGDSLVARIHGGALKDAEIMLAVLSRNSLESKWVSEELDVATVRRIQEDCRLIPVIIGDCPIPDAVAHLFQIRVRRDEVRRAADEIVRAVFNVSAAPPLGEPPPYANPRTPGMAATDVVVMRLICEATLGDPDAYFDLAELATTAEKEGLSEDAFTESLEVLSEQGYVDVPQGSSGRFNGMLAAKATSEGLLAYVESTTPGFEEVVATIANEVRQGASDSGIAHTVGLPVALVAALLDRFELMGWVSVTRVAGTSGHIIVDRVSPLLRRQLM